MKRRDFFKVITEFVVGVWALFVPRAKGEDEYFWIETKTLPWERLGCKDCFKECRHWDECMDLLGKRVAAREKATRSGTKFGGR